MSFLTVDRAFAATILGIDPRSLVQTEAAQGGRNAPTQGSSALKMGIVRVPLDGRTPTDVVLYRFNRDGRRAVETWPSITYEMIGCQFNPQRYVDKSDNFRTPVPTSFVEVRLPNGRTRRGPSLLRVRDNPEPYDVMFEVRVWTKDDSHQMVLLKTILDALPARGFIVGYLNDGTRKSWDLRQSTMNKVDEKSPTTENVQVRGSHWVLTYVVETHMDNSEATSLVRTVTSPPELDLRLTTKQTQPRAEVISVDLTPSQAVFTQDQPLSFVATANLSDSTQADVTQIAEWSCSDDALLRRTAPGRFVGGVSNSETRQVIVSATFRGTVGRALARGIRLLGE